MSIANKLARKELIDMVPYQSARRLFASGGATQGKVWLNANEASGTGSYQVNSDSINRYPDFQPQKLINAYSQYSEIAPENLLATRGADEGIELIIRTFCQAYQDSIIICPPTYGMYAISAENHGADIIKVPLTSTMSLDLTGLKAQVGQAKVVFLCSPGNPTGNLLAQQDIKAALELFAETAIVVVDEAYIEFSPAQTVASWLEHYPHLVILRTLSKAFALAGLRCGFTLANTDVITMLSKVIAPYPISTPVADIASEALANPGLEHMRTRVNETDTLRTQLATWLNAQQWCSEVFNSDANFVLFRCKSTELKDFIFNGLVEQGILIRDQSKQQNLANCLRISIGSESELSLLQQTIINSFTTTTAQTLAQEN
ncbi:histidinol-phosphate transaminase [Colwellia sp. 6M3]|jgi:histidinol-phosphate aminotransferase|uniref:histidinol-phosphate transaminase n=1 Tax=Colwellia sp. 6M3 TaxID=2759849 RepID=UPI0015F42DC7|nr:histidinol-phosphate transaminase [Colwellia sp. 6M3]MBA6416015.1 histidinol-phosphate transaminase [Colwellia sp. 6M3]|tara:strand:+ start:1001 stop:2122 length:1122 start_codon:yes stop_codon:yes gene_type:complete